MRRRRVQILSIKNSGGDQRPRVPGKPVGIDSGGLDFGGTVVVVCDVGAAGTLDQVFGVNFGRTDSMADASVLPVLQHLCCL